MSLKENELAGGYVVYWTAASSADCTYCAAAEAPANVPSSVLTAAKASSTIHSCFEFLALGSDCDQGLAAHTRDAPATDS